MRYRRSHPGFSLLEIMIVVSISVALFIAIMQIYKLSMQLWWRTANRETQFPLAYVITRSITQDLKDNCGVYVTTVNNDSYPDTTIRIAVPQRVNVVTSTNPYRVDQVDFVNPEKGRIPDHYIEYYVEYEASEPPMKRKTLWRRKLDTSFKQVGPAHQLVEGQYITQFNCNVAATSNKRMLALYTTTISVVGIGAGSDYAINKHRDAEVTHYDPATGKILNPSSMTSTVAARGDI